MSRSHLHRQLKALAGQTPTDLIRTTRLARATHLLAARAGTVSEVAYAVGFKSVAHFSNAFHARYGCRPSAYAEGSAADNREVQGTWEDGVLDYSDIEATLVNGSLPGPIIRYREGDMFRGVIDLITNKDRAAQHRGQC